MLLNQHVLDYKAMIVIKLTKQWRTFSDQHGNLASPIRNMLLRSFDDFTEEVCKNTDPDPIFCGV